MPHRSEEDQRRIALSSGCVLGFFFAASLAVGAWWAVMLLQELGH
jgi:hypothetical protein